MLVLGFFFSLWFVMVKSFGIDDLLASFPSLIYSDAQINLKNENF